MKRLILLLALLLLLPSQALAECAWVLWYRTEFASTVKASWESNDIILAFESLQDCEVELTARVKNLHKERRKKSPEKDVSKIEWMDRGVIRFYNGGKSFLSHTFVCLPDTVDPRGKKD